MVWATMHPRPRAQSRGLNGGGTKDDGAPRGAGAAAWPRVVGPAARPPRPQALGRGRCGRHGRRCGHGRTWRRGRPHGAKLPPRGRRAPSCDCGCFLCASRFVSARNCKPLFLISGPPGRVSRQSAFLRVLSTLHRSFGYKLIHSLMRSRPRCVLRTPHTIHTLLVYSRQLSFTARGSRV